MGSDLKIFGASRLAAAGYFLLSAGVGSLIFLPGAPDYVAHAPLHGKLSFFNSWAPEHRLIAACVVAGLMAAAALMFFKIIVDNRMVLTGSEGIEVRHVLGTQRALWRDFETIRQRRLVKGAYYIHFSPGRDARGRRMTRKIRLPSPLLGVDLKGVLVELTVHGAMGIAAAHGLRRAPELATSVRQAANQHIPVQPGPRVFGKRRAS